MNKAAILTKLLIDTTMTQHRMSVSEDVIIALYEDVEIAQHIEIVVNKIKATATKKATQNRAQCSQKTPTILLLPPARDLTQQVITTQEETTLKPGQIPQNRPPASIENPFVRQPIAQITLSNAKVGTLFNSSIKISLDTQEIAKIESVTLPEALGIEFDAENICLTGMPTQSGNFTLTVNWSVQTRQYSNDVLLIINPDPRSLWQINEPPANSLYPKTHIDSQIILEKEIRIAAASRRGRSHEHAGTFRDDDYHIHHDSQSQWNILIVADGAGSARYSREGSRIAVNTISDYLKTQLSIDNHDIFAPYLETIHQWDGRSSIKEVGDFFAKLFHNAAQLAVNNLKNEAIRINEPVKSFSTTLLATLTLRIDDALFAASFWMGDGAIVAYSPTKKVRLLGTPDSGEYAGQTRFLDDNAINDNDFNRRIIIGKWTDVSHLILMTDGISDPYFETDNGLKDPEKWATFINEISPCLATPENADKALAEWLNFFSAGNHDDRTLIVAW